RIADEILRNGTYGIITVGYGPLVTDLAALQAMSGGSACSFTANDARGLLSQVNSVKLLILEADANGGIYCGMSPSTTTVGTTTTAAPTTTITVPETTTTLSSTEWMTTTEVLEALRFDILFLVDVSREAKDRLDDEMMSAYDVSQQNVRVGLIAVRSDETGSTTVANLETFKTYKELSYEVGKMKGYADFKHDGQAIEE
ncbi:hypothetical protein OSTOST_09631, partial [Ostertagia ostertagi]